MEVISEAHVFAEKAGLGSETLEALIELNYGPLATSMSKRLTTGAYTPAKGMGEVRDRNVKLMIVGEKPWSDLNLALKDVRHGINCAETAGTRLKVAEVTLEHLERAKAHSVQESDRPLDSSSMYGIIRKDAGLDFETVVVKDRDMECSWR